MSCSLYFDVCTRHIFFLLYVQRYIYVNVDRSKGLPEEERELTAYLLSNNP